MTDRARAVLAYLGRRRTAYARTFETPHAQVVLEDLAGFCRANETTFHEDARAAALLEGRREVWLRIQQHLNMSPEELFRLSTGEPEAPRVEPRDSG
jgi:hypothetical protein